MDNFNQALNALINGEVIAYPTEGVFGLGCDPDNGEAINKLLQLKQRSAEKGLILIAANYQQLAKYIDESQLTAEQLQRVKESWPAAITWIMPRGAAASDLVCGEHQSIAVRVTDHPLVQKICNSFGKPLTSTSANLSGLPSCLTTEEVRSQFGSQQLVVLEGKTGGRTAPSEIRDAKTLQVLRQG